MTRVFLVCATVLACLAPVLAQAGSPAASQADPPGAEQGDEAVGDPSLERAQGLFDAGVAKFDTADYAGAIEMWTQAYGLVPNEPDYALIKAKLIANLASAQEHAYEVDAEVSHLNQAKILLESYGEAVVDLYPEPAERDKELAWVAERVAEVDAELELVAEAEAEAAERAKQEAQAQREADAQREAERERFEQMPTGRGFILGGSAVIALGGGALGVMVGGMVIGSQNNDISDLPSNELEARKQRYAQGRFGNVLAIAGAAGGAALLGTGIALLAVGLKKRAAHAEERATWTLVPSFDPRGQSVGLGLVGRF